MNPIAVLFILLLVFVLTGYSSKTNLILLFSVAVLMVMINIAEDRKKSSGETESFLTDNVINTRLTSPNDSIISETDLRSGIKSYPQTPSQEYVEGKKLGVDESGKPDMPINPEICLDIQGRDAVNAAYGVPIPVRGTDKDDVIHLYDEMQGSIDDSMANVMSATSKLAKDSFTNRSRFNKRAFSKYLVEELNFHENRYGWWNDDTLEMSM